MNTAQKRKLIFSAVIAFCLLFPLDWTGVTGRGFPTSWAEASIELCVNVGWTILFTVVSYFVLIRPRRRPTDQADSSTQVPDRQQRDGESRANPKG